jgi:hypothetical protein
MQLNIEHPTIIWCHYTLTIETKHKGSQYEKHRISKSFNYITIRLHSLPCNFLQKAFVEHPQNNDQAEAAKRVILRGLRRRLGEAKGNWAEELHHVLWAYQITPHSTTGGTLFRLTYKTETVIPVELIELS